MMKGRESTRMDAQLCHGEEGAALLVTFFLMLTLSGLALAAGIFSQNSLVSSRGQLFDKQAFYVAEAGWQRARQALTANTWSSAVSPGHTYTESFSPGEYQVTIVESGNCAYGSNTCTYTITSNGYVPSSASYLARRQVIEDEIDVTATNTNLSLTATASASSSIGHNTPDQAKDGSTSTKWQAGTNGSGSWLAMDYGSATTLDKIIIIDKDDSNVDGFTVEWSDNYSTWTMASGLSVVETDKRTWIATFTPASHRYLRAVFTSPHNKKAGVKEMESYNSANQSLTLAQGDVTTQW